MFKRGIRAVQIVNSSQPTGPTIQTMSMIQSPPRQTSEYPAINF